MEADQDLLRALAVVLGVSAATTALFRRLHQPVVLGYIVAGIVVGPHVAIPLVADPAIIHTLSDLGVTLLMFYLGLEFSLRKLLRVGVGVTFTSIAQCSILSWLGFTAGRIFGWTTLESLFTGALIAISSTTIIAKAFEEQRIRGKLRDVVVGTLIVEDLVAVLFLTGLTTIATGTGLSAIALGKTAGRLGIFLVALIAGGLLVIPRAIRFVVRLGRPEATVVASVGLCFATALLAREAGYSVALGAFIGGSLVAESGEEKTIAPLVEPVRDVFAAIFFVSVGMMIVPDLIEQHWRKIVTLVVIVVVGKILSISLGIFLSGYGTRTAIRAGMSLAQIGEFSFIIAGLGVSLGATRDFIYPIAVGVSAITTLLTPWLIRASDPVARWVDRKLPAPLQTFASLYGSWVERLGTSPAKSQSAVRRLVRLLAIDAGALTVIIVAAALGAQSAVLFLIGKGLGIQTAWAIVAVVVAALGLPFAVGILRVGMRLGRTLAEAAFPVEKEGPDLGAAPRRALAVTLELALLLLVGVPLVAITQPFLRGFQGAQLLVIVVVVLAAMFWRTTTNLDGHVKAGTQVIVEALASQSHAPGPVQTPSRLAAILEGLGEPVAVEIGTESPAAGKTLAELNLRGRTGATVLAITHSDKATVVPSAHERLRAGDVLAIAGTREAVEAARALLARLEVDLEPTPT